MKKKSKIANWPTPNPEIEAALGRFIIAWAVLEQQLDLAICEGTRLDHDLATSITANLGTKAKLDIYQALAHCYRDLLGELLKTVDKLVSDTAKASGKLRNFVVHGQPFVLDLGEQGKREIWGRQSARKGGVRVEIVGLTVGYVEDQTATIKELIERWIDVRTKADREIGLWHDFKDVDL
jgi:hypothetical protein